MRLLKVVTILLILSGMGFSQTAGKITGYVKDSQTGAPLAGANVVIEGTILGAATDGEGYYVILNVPPDEYNVSAFFIGYAPYRITGVRVNIDLTTELSFPMQSQAIQGETVTVVAEMPVVKKDVAGSQLNMSSEEIEVLPATSVGGVLGMKAGITSDLSIRGSGSDQTLFMVDGITQRDSRNNSPIQSVPLSAIQEVSVQTGGMSAEFSNVRSGVVNVVAKEGPKDYYTATLSYKYSPPAAKHFGVSAYDPESYWLKPKLDDDLAWFGMAASDMDYWTQLQYVGNQFEGWNSVAARTLQDGDPSTDLTAAAAQRIFRWQYRKDGHIRKPDYNIDLGFGGPIPGAKALGALRFYASYFENKNMYMLPLSRDGVYNNSGMLKITSDISRKTKLNIIGNFSSISATSAGGTSYFTSSYGIANAIDRAGFTGPWRVFTHEYFTSIWIDSKSLAAKLTHMFDAASVGELTVSRIQRNYTKGYNKARDYDAKYEIFPGYFVDEAPIGWTLEYNNGIDGIAMGGPFATARDTSKIVTYNVKTNYRSQINKYNQVKAGLDFTFDNLSVFMRGINPLPDGQYYTKFNRNPYRLSMFVEDKLEFEGLVTTLGLVGDFIAPNSEWYKPASLYDVNFFGSFPEAWNEMENVPDSLKEKAEWQFKVSPRLGISHPISETAKLFFNYGHYYQLPSAENMFELEYQFSTSQVNYFGNPSLGLARTISYEVGFDKSLLDQYL
ncbi:MAG TPA: TonB-dependent receptor, partial [Candidatus Marinimicrobia bacterium]|nr:TonB-dependent receptor [Candidatus Neomarinimicrobiota bacterium]